MKRIFQSALVLAVLLAPLYPARSAGTNAIHDFTKWDKEISAYERSDVTNPPAKGSFVFIGSSTIARWKTLAQDFPGQPVVNRGFGGSEIVDSTYFAPRVVFPYEPKMVFLRAGGNDLWAGKSVEQVFADYTDFVATIHTKLPKARIVFISLSPSLARWTQHDQEKAVNDRVVKYIQDKPYLQYIETYDIPLGTNGQPRADLFVADKLHFNAAGYKLLAERVRPALSK